MRLAWAFLWLPLAPLMIANGAARELLYAPSMSEPWAHRLSTLTGSLLVLGYTSLVVPRMRLTDDRDALAAGGVWLVLTVAFEFGFGHFVMGHPWSRLVADYDLTAGRIWVLLLLVVLLAPWTARRHRDSAGDPS